MKRIITLFGLFVFAASCSTMSKHFVQKGTLAFDGGVYKNKTWDDDLVFKRVTWYREFTAMYDLAWSKIDTKSPFFSWFSGEERAKIRSSIGPCFVALSYFEDSKKISTSMFLEQMRKQGFEKINVNRFAKYLKVHPQAGEYSLHQYKVYGLCSKTDVDLVKIDFPGFNTVEIK